MLLKKIKYLVLSDIHFGSNKNKTEDIVRHLIQYFIKYDKILRTLDMIIIAGDIYDRLLTSASTDNIVSLEWLTTLVHYCKKNKIRLRILEGTPSHDSKQATVINTILHRLKIDIDFKYIDAVMVEVIDEFNLSILYVPDEVHHEASAVLEEVKSTLDDKGLDKVDIAIMHGAFRYQIPIIELPSMHDEHEYLSLVKYFISIGHIHSMSIYKRILAQGSFDRMAHNEEEDKGGMVITLDPNEEPSYIFLINDNATTFKTIDVTTEEVNVLIKELEVKLREYKDGSYIRLKIELGNPILKSLLDIYKKFKQYNFDKLTVDNKTETKVTDNVLKSNPIANINITPNNIEELLYAEIDLPNVDKELVKLIENEVKQILKG